jgi:unsaturated rhamnogalacturonyl hydrolase
MKKILDLCDYLVKVWIPEEKRWGWGEGLFAYALTRLDSYLGEDRYYPFVKRYIDRHVAHTPEINSSDTAAPGLASYFLQRKTGDVRYKALTDKVINYIKNTDKIIEDLPNHFGTSKDAKDYPFSVWVDSLMMFGVFTVLYGKEEGDRELLEYGARLPGQFAKYLMDKDEHLWYHSYRVKQHTHYPRRKIFWGRGNGWVIAALPMIAEILGKEHPKSAEIIKIFQQTSAALLRYQRADGAFETVFNKVGKTYRELSATALIAGGWLDGIAQGILDESVFLAPAMKAYEACEGSIIYEDGGVFFPEISRPTVPMKIIPYTWYKRMPRGRNWNYGVAALVLAAINKQKYLNRK